MAPNHAPSDDDVVIAGISGRFPCSDSMDEFAYNLYNGINMASTQIHWDTDVFDGAPARLGGIKSFEKFDAEFFGLNPKEANFINAVQQKRLECIFEAMVDAGLNPAELRGSNTGIFVGDCFPPTPLNTELLDSYTSEFSLVYINEPHFFDLKGPVFHVDTACASSLNTFHEAVKYIKAGICDTIVMSTGNGIFDPMCSYQMNRQGFLSNPGACKSLSADADGYMRSEAVIAVILQKRKMAKRAYATVLASVTNCDGYTPEGITFPGKERQEILMRMAYNQINMDPRELKLIEGHSTGTQAGDPAETNAIHSVFCGNGRKDPILLGAVKSNLGHTEGSAGLVTVAKSILTFQNECVPPNLHFKNPNPNLIGVLSGEIIPVTRPTEFKHDMIGINSFGFGGANAHVILKKEADKTDPNGCNPLKTLPRLILIQGRTRESVQYIYDYVKKNKKTQTANFLYLLDEYAVAGGKFDFRGFMIMDQSLNQFHVTEPKEVVETSPINLYFPDFTAKPSGYRIPVEMVFFPPFLDSLKRSKQTVVRLGYEWATLSAEMMTAVNQIAWVDTLKKMDFRPDQLVGSGQGELACAYFSGQISADQMLTAVSTSMDNKFSQDILSGLGGKEKQWITVATMNGNLGKETTIEVAASGLMTKNQSGKVNSLSIIPMLETLGSLYTAGVNFKLSQLYGEPCFPLPSSTPCLSPLVKWNHEKSYKMERDLAREGSNVYTIRLKTIHYFFDPTMPEDAFILDHKVDSRTLFPATGYLAIAMSCACRLRNLSPKEATVELKDVTFLRATMVTEGKDLSLTCRMNEDTGRFEIHEKDALAVTGYAFISNFDGNLPNFIPEEPKVKFTMSSPDIYKEFRVRGYDYETYFQNVQDVTSDGLTATVSWRDTMVSTARENFNAMKVYDRDEMDFLRRWICFTDSMMQTLMMNPDSIGRGLFVPTKLKEIKCNPKVFLENVNSSPKSLDPVTSSDRNLVTVHGCTFEHSVFTKGIQIIGLKTSLIKKGIEIVTTGRIVFNPMKEQITVKRIESAEAENADGDHQEKKIPAPFDSEDFYPKTVFDSMLQFVIQNLAWKRTVINVHEVTSINSSHNFKKVFDDFDKNSVYSDMIDFKYQHVQEDPNNNGPSYDADHNILIEKTFFDTNQEQIDRLYDRTAENGFCFLYCDTSKSPNIRNFIENSGFKQIMEKSVSCGNESITTFVLRKVLITLDPKDQIILKCSLKNYLWVEDLQKQLMVSSEEGSNKKIWLVPDMTDEVTSDHKVSGLIGFTKSLRYETGGDKIRCIVDFRTKSGLFGSSGITFSNQEYQEVLEKDLVINIYDDKTESWVHQSTLLDEMTIQEDFSPRKEVYLKPLNPGDLTSLTWVQSELPFSGPKKNLVDIYYAPLNFKDVMYATGNLPIDLLYGVSAIEARDSLLGLEFAGVVRQTGKRVCGPVLFKGMATSLDITGAEDFIFPVPDDWTLEEASTIPAVYLTALYALIMKGNIRKGESILIHAGAGGVGIAALNICFHHEMEVFVTVGSEEKRKFLLTEFPELKEENIFNSRTLQFEEQLLKATNGNGVDLVLNSLAGDFLKASLRCLAVNGRFLEIGKADLIRDMKLNTPDYDGNKSFIGVCLDRIYKVPSAMAKHDYPSSEADRHALKKILMNGMKQGYVKPIKSTLYEMNQAEEAFRFMASGKHIGKIVIKIRDENNNQENDAKSDLRITKQTFFYPHKSYVIIGGLGGLGLEVAQWMSERGAKRIVLATRRGISEAYQQNAIHQMELRGAKVVVSQNDATTENGCVRIIEDAYKMGAIGAIINSAAVLDDMLMDVMTPESFEKVASSKVLSTIYMDQLSREYCPELDYFIGFSSISNNRGNLGQTNYNYGNSVIDAICEKRRKEGLHGLSIQWGIIGDVGLVMNKGGYNGKVMLSTTTQRIESCIATLDKFIQMKESVVISFVKSRELIGSGDDGDLMKLLNRVVGFKDIGSMDKTANLGSLGIDSLMAVELQQMLERVKGVSISIKDLRSMTIQDFMDLSNAEKKQ